VGLEFGLRRVGVIWGQGMTLDKFLMLKVGGWRHKIKEKGIMEYWNNGKKVAGYELQVKPLTTDDSR